TGSASSPLAPRSCEVPFRRSASPRRPSLSTQPSLPTKLATKFAICRLRVPSVLATRNASRNGTAARAARFRRASRWGLGAGPVVGEHGEAGIPGSPLLGRKLLLALFGGAT